MSPSEELGTLGHPFTGSSTGHSDRISFKIERFKLEIQVEADVYVLAAGANSSKVAAQAGHHNDTTFKMRCRGIY